MIAWLTLALVLLTGPAQAITITDGWVLADRHGTSRATSDFAGQYHLVGDGFVLTGVSVESWLPTTAQIGPTVDLSQTVRVPGGSLTFHTEPFQGTGAFTMTGSVDGMSLDGHGTATWTAGALLGGQAAQSARYDFAATPEPGTMLLLGSGLVATATASWLRRRRRS